MQSPWSLLGHNWGHPWHSMCSYLGTYPAGLARSLIELLSDPGDVILDPFSGRGTTLLEARLSGRTVLASDLNPIAIALTKAKAVNLSEAEIYDRIDSLQSRYDAFLYLPEAQVQDEDIQLIYSPKTLAQLCYLRRNLVASESEVDQFLVGAILGIMHGGERQDGTSAYASISMPNTFSMSPGYVKRFVETKNLNRVSRNVFQLLKEKVERLYKEGGVTGGECIVETADAKHLHETKSFKPYKGKVKLILTSPPYLGVVNYAKQNWIRNWFLETHPDFEKSNDLDDELTLEKWLKFSEVIVQEMREMLSPDGVIAFVVGDVSKKSGGFISLAREFIQRVHHQGMFEYVGCFADDIGSDNKTTRIWKDTKGMATNTDRIVILANQKPQFHQEQLLAALFPNQDNDISNIDPDELRKYAIEFSHSEMCSTRRSAAKMNTV